MNSVVPSSLSSRRDSFVCGERVLSSSQSGDSLLSDRSLVALLWKLWHRTGILEPRLPYAFQQAARNDDILGEDLLLGGSAYTNLPDESSSK